MSCKIAVSLSAFVLAVLAVASPAGARPLVAPAPESEFCRGGDCDEEEDKVKLCFQLKYNGCVRPRQACEEACEQTSADGCDAALGDLQARAACKAELAGQCADACDGSLDLAADGDTRPRGTQACLMIDEWVCIGVRG